MQNTEFLRQREIITSYKTNNLIQRFYSHYGPNIQIVPQKGTSSIFCSADISVAQLFKEIGKLQNDTQVDFSDTEENEIPHNLEFNRMSFHSAKRIRETVKDMGKQVTSNQTLPVELELSYKSAAKLVPNSSYNHLAWLLTDLSADVPASGKVELDQAAHEKVLNLAQDIMGNVNKIPTPKQVGLSLHILKETNKQENCYSS